MAGFLRKKVTLSRKVTLRDTQHSFTISPEFEKPSSDVPPSLPPLLLSFSLVDPDPILPTHPSLPPAASPPVVALPPEYLAFDDAWNPWEAYTAPRLDGPPRPNLSEPKKHAPPQPARDTSHMPPSVRPPPQSARLPGPFSWLHHTIPSSDFHISI